LDSNTHLSRHHQPPSKWLGEPAVATSRDVRNAGETKTAEAAAMRTGSQNHGVRRGVMPVSLCLLHSKQPARSVSHRQRVQITAVIALQRALTRSVRGMKTC
jgi:hypothetical protein